MKKVNLFLVSAVTFVTLCGGFSSCSKDDPKDELGVEEPGKVPDPPEENNDNDSIVIVKFLVDMEASISDLKSAIDDPNGLYGVNVFQRYDNANTSDDKSKIGNPYAFGYFDNLGSLILQLVKGKKYNFEMVYVPNGKNIIHQYPDGHYGNPVAEQLYGGGDSNGKINEFVYSGSGFYIDMLNYGASQAKGITDYRTQSNLFNEIERYQGLLWNFDPNQGQPLNIKLYRMMFGIRLKVTDFTKGKITIATEYGKKYSVESNQTGTSTLEKVLELPFMPVSMNSFYGNKIDDMREKPFDDKASSAYKFVITYNDGSGEMTLYNQPYYFERMKMHTFEFSVSDGITNSIMQADIHDEGDMTDIKGEW